MTEPGFKPTSSTAKACALTQKSGSEPWKNKAMSKERQKKWKLVNWGTIELGYNLSFISVPQVHAHIC